MNDRKRPPVVDLRQVDHSRNRFRRYRIRECRTLFGKPCLVIEWGRIGSPMRVRTETFATSSALDWRYDELLARRRRHGYLLHPASALHFATVFGATKQPSTLPLVTRMLV